MMDKPSYVLVICAMKSEYEALTNKVQQGRQAVISGIEGTVFPIPSGEAFAFIGSIGKAATAFTIGRLSEACNVKAIINTGVAGSLNSEVLPLDVVVADRVAFHDVDLTAFGNPLGQMDGEPLWYQASPIFLDAAHNITLQRGLQIKFGSIISGDVFATATNISEKIIEQFDHPYAIDMESGAVAMCARKLNVPFAIIRSISDDTRKGDNVTNYEEFLELAAKHASSVTLWMLNALK